MNLRMHTKPVAKDHGQHCSMHSKSDLRFSMECRALHQQPTKGAIATTGASPLLQLWQINEMQAVQTQLAEHQSEAAHL